MNNMGTQFYRKKGVGARQGRKARQMNPENFTGMQGWFLICTDYPEKLFENYKEYQDYDKKVKAMAKARAKKIENTEEKTKQTTKETVEE